MNKTALGLIALIAVAGFASPARAGCSNEIRSIESEARRIVDPQIKRRVTAALADARLAARRGDEPGCMEAVDQARRGLPPLVTPLTKTGFGVAR
ncbi:MAG: hypothetical protein HY057_14885 [Rhodospirillales bacterium]|nr:hypothetical protein [Rhodospirillales bacterium]